MKAMTWIRLSAAAIAIIGGMTLAPNAARAEVLDQCTDEEWQVAIEHANDRCASEGAACFRLYGCEYHEDTGFIVWEYSCQETCGAE